LGGVGGAFQAEFVCLMNTHDIPKATKTKKVESIDVAIAVEKEICSLLSPVQVYIGGVLFDVKNHTAYRYSNQSDTEYPSMDSDYLLNWSHDDQGACLLLLKKGTHEIIKEWNGEARGMVYQNRLLIQEGNHVTLSSLPDLDLQWSLPVQGTPLWIMNESVVVMGSETLCIVNQEGLVVDIPLGYRPDWILLHQDQLIVVQNQFSFYSLQGELLSQTGLDFIPRGYQLTNLQVGQGLLGMSCKKEMNSMLLVFDFDTKKWFRFEEKRKAIRPWDHYVWFVKRKEGGVDAQLWLQNHSTR
jgi:hypothetical protein